MTQVDQVGFSCSACGKQYRWKPELAGKSVKCKCGSAMRVPTQPGGVATAPAAPRATASAGAPRSAHAAPPPPPPPPPPAPKAKPAKRVEEDDGMDALYALADQEAAARMGEVFGRQRVGVRAAVQLDVVLLRLLGQSQRIRVVIA